MFSILTVALIATMLSATPLVNIADSAQEANAAIRIRPPSTSPTTTTTTTTPLPAPRPTYTEDNPLVIGCAGTYPYVQPVEDWATIYDVRNGDYVDLCGTVYLYNGDETTTTPGNCLAATIATDLFSGNTYPAGHRFTPTADSEFQGDAYRFRMRVFDANGERVQTQNRWDHKDHWEKPFRLKKTLLNGTYTVEIRAWFEEEADGCGPTVWTENTIIAIG